MTWREYLSPSVSYPRLRMVPIGPEDFDTERAGLCVVLRLHNDATNREAAGAGCSDCRFVAGVKLRAVLTLPLSDRQE